MPKKIVALLIAILSASALIGISSTPAQASGAIQFRKFYYDSPGSDTGTNYSLNAEWFVLKNISTTTRNLYGWKVSDASSHVYTFSSNFYLRPGYTVKIHTGKGTNTSTNRYWGKASYVWNNSGDTATLRRRDGTKIDTCSWSSIGLGYKYC